LRPECAFRVSAVAARAVALEEDFVVDDAMSEPLGSGEADLPLAEREDVVKRSALQAHEMMMAVRRVGIVPRRATSIHLLDFAYRHQLVQRVVHSGEADLRELSPRPREHLFGGQMDMVSIEDLGNDATLRRHAPALPAPEAFEERP
jgi:hypothetical protein